MTTLKLSDTLLKGFYTKITFWIFIFFLIRLIGITNPPLEIGHSWRQITGLMVSRNYLEVDASIIYPRVDDNSGTEGIIPMEFPSMNYIYYLISSVFGYTHWYGRLINLIISSIGLFFFYRLICLSGIKERIAFYATIFLAGSIWFTFSRKMMPDTYCISIMFVALYYGLLYLKETKRYALILFILLATLAILSKIPAGMYFVLLIPLLLDKSYLLRKRLYLLFSCVIPLFFTYIWYFVWNPYLAKQYGIWYNLGNTFSNGLKEISANFNLVLYNFYFNSFSSYSLFLLFVAGLVLIFIRKEKKIIISFLLMFVVYLLFIIKSGYFFFHHSYYIIPFVPVMALIAGYTISCISKKWMIILLLLVSVGEGIANQQHDLFIKESEMYKINLEGIINKISKPTDLILINGDENPQLIYLTHRKGWSCSNEKLSDSLFVNQVIVNQCKFIIIDKHNGIDVQQLTLPFSPVFENNDFLILSTIKSK